MIAEVIPLARLPKNLSFFDYEVPQNFEGQIKIGQIVRIPLRGKNVSGMVATLKERPAEIKTSIKPITKISDFTINLDSEHLLFLLWLSDYYLVSPALLLKTLLPEPPLRASDFMIKSKPLAVSFGVSASDLGEIREMVEKITFPEKRCSVFHYNNYKNKTAVLLKITEKVIGQDGDVLILEPQIPDIDKIVPYFVNLFPKKTALLHGELSKTEYWQEWQKIKEGTTRIVFGTRSALLAPLKNIKLIIIDDEESPDFKQSDQNPRYDARKAALKLSELTGAKIVFTSQSLRPETYFWSKNSPEVQYLPSKTLGQSAELIDMSNEIKNKNFSSLSEKLRQAASETMEKKQKIVLLLNRRGLSTLILCRDCDYVFECKNCKMPLACHDDECSLPNQFVCHNCGIAEPVQLVCPKCRGTAIKYLGVGTQTVEKEIEKFFPLAKILRIDKDAEILDIKEKIQNADILIGTQFFIRNFLPKVQKIGLIGIVSADTLIYRPDFRSGEKTFSWLTGLINFGRQIKSRVLVQTFFSNNFFIQSAINGDYKNFYQQELADRKILGYPPFGKLVKLTYADFDEKKSVFETDNLFKKLNKGLGGQAEISYDEKPRKEKKKYFSRIIIKFSTASAVKIKNVLRETVPDDWTIDIDPESII